MSYDCIKGNKIYLIKKIILRQIINCYNYKLNYDCISIYFLLLVIRLPKEFDEIDDAATRRRKKKNYYAKLRKQEEEREKELAEKYRDRVRAQCTQFKRLLSQQFSMISSEIHCCSTFFRQEKGEMVLTLIINILTQHLLQKQPNIGQWLQLLMLRKYLQNQIIFSAGIYVPVWLDRILSYLQETN